MESKKSDALGPKSAPERPRKHYTSPQVTRFGTLAELTRQGPTEWPGGVPGNPFDPLGGNTPLP